MFITQHMWKDTVKAFINVESMGNSGKEILFQVNSPFLADSYSKVPHPHGNVLVTHALKLTLV